MTHQFFHRVLTKEDVGDTQERCFQPFPQQPATHSRVSLIEDIEKCSLPPSVAYILCDFQMADACRINDQTPFIIDTFQVIDMRNIRLHNFADIG